MRMKKLGLSKLYFQLAESKDSMARSIEACQNAGLDTDYTMGQAIKLFIEKNKTPALPLKVQEKIIKIDLAGFWILWIYF